MQVVPFVLHIGLDAGVALLAFWIMEALEVGTEFHMQQTPFLLCLVTKSPSSQDTFMCRCELKQSCGQGRALKVSSTREKNWSKFCGKILFFLLQSTLCNPVCV